MRSAPRLGAGSSSPSRDDEFVAFARGVAPRLLAAAGRLAPAGADVEGIASESLARAYLHWDKLRGAPYRAAWVYRVAVNLAYDAGRRAASARNAAGPEPAASERLDDAAALRTDLVRALGRLSARQRTAVVLHHIADLPVEDVARLMHVAPGTVRKHLERGRASLRASLGPRAEGVADA